QFSRQTYPEFEVVLVIGAAPCSRAHNAGARASQGEIIIFFDDDVELGDDTVVASLVETLTSAANIGIAGAGQILPPDSSDFQRKCGDQMHRATFEPVDEVVETNGISHAGMAMRRSVFDAVGGEFDDLRRNDDVYLRKRIEDEGLVTVAAPRAWVYHPMPSGLWQLIKKRFGDGLAIAGDYKLYPEHIYYSPIDTAEEIKPSGILRQMTRNISFLIRAITGLKIISLSERLGLAAGYALGATRSKNYHRRSLDKLSRDGKIRRLQKRGSTLD
ncbi:MAG: glycosyltransferase, partial [Actinomycetia bacterium]|nr:glycosyltransferase [Actinomycetes bacterium]